MYESVVVLSIKCQNMVANVEACRFKCCDLWFSIMHLCLFDLTLCSSNVISLVPAQDSDIQKKIDHEIRMRDGACKLLAACSQKDQALEAAKNLQTCSTRIMAYMSELQRMKEAQVMQKVTRRSSDAGPMDDRLPCKGRVAISGKHKISDKLCVCCFHVLRDEDPQIQSLFR